MRGPQAQPPPQQPTISPLSRQQRRALGHQNGTAWFFSFGDGPSDDETIPEGIPPGVAWNQLETKRKIPAKVKSIRGKLNVPRERFHLTSDGRYLWAGMPC